MVTLGHIGMRQNFNLETHIQTDFRTCRAAILNLTLMNSLTIKCMMLFIIKKEISRNLYNGSKNRENQKKLYFWVGFPPGWCPPLHTLHMCA